MTTMQCTGYSTTFEKGSPIWNLYKKLKDDGVKDADLDQGYPKTDYVKDTRSTVNCKIEEQEVLGYALERHERYRLAIKETMGYEVPWTFDDLDPKTVFDAAITEKATKAIKMFDTIIVMNGDRPGTDQYKVKLATALLLYALEPSGASAPKEGDRQNVIMAYIHKYGGLGLGGFKGECAVTSDALKALRQKCGACVEKSLVLLALFKLAGLNAHLMAGTVNRNAIAAVKAAKVNGHVLVGLKLSDRTAYYDAAYLDLSLDQTLFEKGFDHRYQMTNLELLSQFYSNHENSSLPDLLKAVAINPNNSTALARLGFAYDAQGKTELAVRSFRQVIRFDPAVGHGMLGLYYFGKNNLALAEKEVKKSLQTKQAGSGYHGLLADIYFLKGQSAYKRKDKAGALDLMQKALLELVTAYEQEVLQTKKDEYLNKGIQIKQLVEGMSKELGSWSAFVSDLSPELKDDLSQLERMKDSLEGSDQPAGKKVEIYCALGDKYYQMNQLPKALGYYQKAVSLDRKKQEALFGIWTTYKALGETKKAETACKTYGKVSRDKHLSCKIEEE